MVFFFLLFGRCVVSMLVVGPPFLNHPLKNVMGKDEVCNQCLVYFVIHLPQNFKYASCCFSFQASSNFHCFGSLGRFKWIWR